MSRRSGLTFFDFGEIGAQLTREPSLPSRCVEPVAIEPIGLNWFDFVMPN